MIVREKYMGARRIHLLSEKGAWVIMVKAKNEANTAIQLPSTVY